MKIFATGATGFIGKYLLKQLAGHEILCLSRSPTSSLRTENVRWLVGDLQNCSILTAELERFEPDVAIHLAWQGLPNYSEETCEQNVQMSLRLMSVLVQTSVKRVVVAGSCFEYGSAGGALSESLKVDANNDFAKAKLRVLNEFNFSCSSANIELVWSRIFYSFGPGQRDSSLLPTVYRALVKRDEPIVKMPGAVQDFVFIDDVASALSKLAITKSVSGVFNIGSGTPISVAKVVNSIAKSCGSDFRIENIEHLPGSWASIDKIEQVTGWKPRFTLEQGVAESIKELKKASF